MGHRYLSHTITTTEKSVLETIGRLIVELPLRDPLTLRPIE